MRTSLALAWGLTVGVALYAILRGVQLLLFPEPNPATLVWSAHSGFFWRCLIVAFASGIAATVASLFETAPLARRLPTAVIVAGALIAAQGLALP